MKFSIFFALIILSVLIFNINSIQGRTFLPINSPIPASIEMSKCLDKVLVQIKSSMEWSTFSSISFTNSTIFLFDDNFYYANSSSTGNRNIFAGNNNTIQNQTMLPMMNETSWASRGNSSIARVNSTDIPHTFHMTEMVWESMINATRDNMTNYIYYSDFYHAHNKSTCYTNSVLYIDDSTFWAMNDTLTIINSHIFAYDTLAVGMNGLFSSDNNFTWTNTTKLTN